MELASVRILVSDLPAASKFYADVVGLAPIGGSPEVTLFGTNPQHPSGNTITFLQCPAQSKG